jgi:hypothetical protein
LTVSHRPSPWTGASPSSSSTSLVLSCTHARTPQAGPRRQHRSCNARARSRLPLWVVVVSCLHRTPLFPFVFLRQFDLFSSELSHYPVSRQKPRRSHPVNSSHVRRNQASLLLRIHPSKPEAKFPDDKIPHLFVLF